MEFEKTDLDGVLVVSQNVLKDVRGFFNRLYCRNTFSEYGCNKDIVQINHTLTNLSGTVRGLHFQYPPFAETKIVKCIRGRVYDYIVDVRKNSESFLQHIIVELSEANQQMVIIPEGFAHGFQTMEANTEMLYFHTNYYSNEHEGGVNFADPRLRIGLQLPVAEISERDKNLPFINNSFTGVTL